MSNLFLEELLDAYGELRPYLARRLGGPNDAEDVAQSIFERVYPHNFQATITSPRALLFRAAQRICIDAARRKTVARR